MWALHVSLNNFDYISHRINKAFNCKIYVFIDYMIGSIRLFHLEIDYSINVHHITISQNSITSLQLVDTITLYRSFLMITWFTEITLSLQMKSADLIVVQ